VGVFIRALLAFERRSARRRGIPGGIGGAATAIQRFGSAINLNVHFHTLAIQGVFIAEPDGSCRFVPSPAPTDVEVERLLASIRRRIVRLARYRGIELEQPSGEVHPTDELALESPVLAEISGASVLGRVATGPRAGAPVQRIGRNPPATPRARSRTRPPYYSWASLMRRTFEFDVLSCPGCGGRLRLLATIDDPAVIKKILAHLGMPTEPPDARPARSPPRLSADLPF
jgi:hypothetical protein